VPKASASSDMAHKSAETIIFYLSPERVPIDFIKQIPLPTTDTAVSHVTLSISINFFFKAPHPHPPDPTLVSNPMSKFSVSTHYNHSEGKAVYFSTL
jgi:hypothetical protein